jgi:gamma-glutamylcyclotransferase (GGCT)/AIG2-like uncharacterized protein YtfP
MSNDLASRIKDTMSELRARRYFTPDFKDDIEPYENHLVFVYDSLKHTFPHQKETASLPFLGEAYTLDPNYVMRTTPGYPIIFERKKGNEGSQFAGSVLGHVFAARPLDMVHMDAYYDNGNSYQRKQRWVALMTQESPYKSPERLVTVKAWVYEATPQFAAEVCKGAIGGSMRAVKDKSMWEWRHQNLPN